ncbi:type III-A CRISPR-associated protein Csm2 [Microbulbifer flavimaris]|uniref:CRISPR system Cms protein Csm2 n=1 Tax=Microbulbifer flavimaris TaxID=1781068 RepID=A0ABX4I0G2_9GAMM|nr:MULTISPECIES: type III-A CRISPR-associated protein Csm2 [Microbulbifer]KUJ83445.1 hypothetical protein AVO43_06160 [Microbulbifer sp. ZGT114]PCO05601.1 type III-A CRISPR-associated protein Csm2 [Microbulbifer flavimaris]
MNRHPVNEGNTDPIELSGIDLSKVSMELFDSVADGCAKHIAGSTRGLRKKTSSGVNKSTQLRRFYDEIVMWDQRFRQHPESYSEQLPLVKMLNAKVSYAHSRDLVCENFVNLLRHCLGQLQIEQQETFKNFRLFMEAFMGFYKMHKKD